MWDYEDAPREPDRHYGLAILAGVLALLATLLASTV